MNDKIKIIKLPSGKFAAEASKGKYWSNTVKDTEQEALVERLMQIGRDYSNKLDVIQFKLERLNAVPNSDPYGWRA